MTVVYGWRYRRRLRPLVVRPRSRGLPDRCGLIVGLLAVTVTVPRRLDRVYMTARVR